MIGRLILTAVIIGGGAFLLLSDSFEEFIAPYAGATATDIENMKNDPVIQTKFNQILESISENFTTIKFSLNDFFSV
ncbi:MAG: hypothetical protein CMO18_01500 [Thaumarchaeota archaeon]|jgi:hypothetical protein|nr:hypothetical protein [Nitrososphaerota archaeon]|tara:strand:- start:15978 stop:16208 length:231 start_codon:yes stop_codon:yes gene_type:complete